MDFFEIKAKDISEMTDSDLRKLVARLCEAELIQQGLSMSNVFWGGAQEAPDGGLDVNVKESEVLPKPDFVPRANTGFQVKKNSMPKSACTKEMTANGTLKPVIAKLADKKGAYIIVSGKDDCSYLMREERIHGMEAAVSDLKNKNDLFLDFYGSDRLASWLRLHPGVALWARKRLGKPLSGWMPFGRWAATPPNQNDDFLSDEHLCVVDTSSSQRKPISLTDGIRRTRDKLRAPGSIIRIIGLSGVGKTRFAQALFENEVGGNAINSLNVVYADLGVDLTPTPLELISYLIVNNFSPYVVLDNCPPEVHRDLQNKITQDKARLRLITIEYDISDDQPEETQVIHLQPSSEKVVSRLIQRRFPALGAINAQKAAEFSGGNPRLAIALASRVDSNETLTKFTDEELFKRLFSQRKGLTDSLLASAEALSLVFSFNISETDFNDEIGVLAKIFGIARNTLYRRHAELLRSQLAQSRGNWRAVLPHALANRLAKRALQNIPLAEINKELFKFQNLRLLKSCAHRLSFLHDFGPARDLVKSWMQKGAPLEDITSCGEDLLNVLYYIAPVLPDKVLEAIEDAALNPEFTSRNNGNSHQVVRLLCKLAYDDERFERAATIILKFAETERKDENNNSIVHLFSQLFSLYLSGTQASPAQRQQFLKRLVTSGNPRNLEIGKKLFDSAFKTSHWIAMESFSFGARIRDFGWEPKINPERLNWYEGFIDQLRPF
ncbi:hypothetical protein [Dethiosulfatarculus sandiegensis]|uniref:hypothetical protein n=1 Tax=Dethiosulfatarculus sandiegensis TaxID=1429043 RepID=UPI000ABEA87E|nr:hypothetical protein [Dethiosulfatarculus sandiegensis]